MAMRSEPRRPSVPPLPAELVEAAERMQRIVDSLSLSSRLPTTEVQEFDPASLLTSVFTMLGFSARAAGVRLTVDIPPRGLHLLADRSRLLQGLLNLVTNAVQAVGRGGLVTVAARPSESGRSSSKSPSRPGRVEGRCVGSAFPQPGR